MVSGAMCRRFESFQARFTFPAKAGNSRNLLFGRRPRYSFPYSREGEELPKRSGNGEGSVYRRTDGLWVGQYKIETPSRAKTKYIYSKTRKEAAAKLAEAVVERDSGLVYDCRSLTVGDSWTVGSGR
jgi:hypothetical protein